MTDNEQTPVEKAAEALIPYSSAYTNRHMQARKVFGSIDVDELARVLADDWNPARDPILTAMFRDYAQTIRTYLIGDESHE